MRQPNPTIGRYPAPRSIGPTMNHAVSHVREHMLIDCPAIKANNTGNTTHQRVTPFACRELASAEPSPDSLPRSNDMFMKTSPIPYYPIGFQRKKFKHARASNQKQSRFPSTHDSCQSMAFNTVQIWKLQPPALPLIWARNKSSKYVALMNPSLTNLERLNDANAASPSYGRYGAGSTVLPPTRTS